MTVPVLRPDDTVVAAKGTAFSDLAGEGVVLHLRTGRYFGLNRTSATIWQQIQSPSTVGAVRDAVLSAFEVAPERCEAEVIAFLEEMRQAELVVLVPPAGPPGS